MAGRSKRNRPYLVYGAGRVDVLFIRNLRVYRADGWPDEYDVDVYALRGLRPYKWRIWAIRRMVWMYYALARVLHAWDAFRASHYL